MPSTEKPRPDSELIADALRFYLDRAKFATDDPERARYEDLLRQHESKAAQS